MGKESCTCDKCVACCWRNPGWFGSPEEVEGAAQIIGLSAVEFAQEYLIREWWAGEEDVLIPSPRRDFSRHKGKSDKEYWLNGFLPGELSEADQNGRGFVIATWGHNLISGFPCIFLDENDRCKIHESKPRECREVLSCGPKDKKREEFERYTLVGEWRKRQDFVRRLVGEGY